jgi:hypothetical protein
VHIAFLLETFTQSLEVDARVMRDAVWQVVFPLLLVSKGRKRVAEAVWEVVLRNERAGPELFGGCADAWARERESEGGEEEGENMGRLDLELAAKMAGEFSSLCTFEDSVDSMCGALSVSQKILWSRMNILHTSKLFWSN